jgi:hypothetical protein
MYNFFVFQEMDSTSIRAENHGAIISLVDGSNFIVGQCGELIHLIANRIAAYQDVTTTLDPKPGFIIEEQGM